MRRTNHELELHVIQKAVEWFHAKRAAEENAGQPVNWESFNLDELEKAVAKLVEVTPSPEELSLAYGRHV